MHGPPLHLAVALSLLSATGCEENLLNPMAYRQPRANAYAASAFYADGLSMRPYPEGTVARRPPGARPDVGRDTGWVSEGRVDSNGQPVRRYLDEIPEPVTAQLLATGAERYEIFCAVCHGLVGDGQSVVAAQMALRPPPSLHAYADRPPGYVFSVITEGFGVMPAYANELSVPERWAVIAYVQALQLSQSAPVTLAPPAIRSQLQGEVRR